MILLWLGCVNGRFSYNNFIILNVFWLYKMLEINIIIDNIFIYLLNLN